MLSATGYLRFELDSEATLRRKTEVWLVWSTSGGNTLGEIKWFGRWRAYCFFPAPSTTFNDGCLREIADFSERLTREHRAAVRARA